MSFLSEFFTSKPGQTVGSHGTTMGADWSALVHAVKGTGQQIGNLFRGSGDATASVLGNMATTAVRSVIYVPKKIFEFGAKGGWQTGVFVAGALYAGYKGVEAITHGRQLKKAAKIDAEINQIRSQTAALRSAQPGYGQEVASGYGWHPAADAQPGQWTGYHADRQATASLPSAGVGGPG